MLRAVWLAAALAACGSSGTAAPQDTQDPPLCPAPGIGVSMGGVSDVSDDSRSPARRIVLMGGGSEDDQASTRFVESAGGGDVVVLRASGSTTSYPSHFTGTLSPSPAPASAITLLLAEPFGGSDPGVLCRVSHAEAVWLAGGNQWNYLGRWPSELHDTLVALAARGIPIGGTSAGAMSLGQAAFAAERGGVTSEEALSDPRSADVSVALSPFPQPELDGVLVDSHFSERSREGRLLAFLARFIDMTARDRVVGVGLDEGVALVIGDTQYEVFGPEGRGAFFYSLDGDVELTGGEPLSLERVGRVRLAPGATGPWPLDFETHEAVLIQVVDGVVSNAPATRAEAPPAR